MMRQSDDIRIAIVHRDGLYRDSLRYCLTQTEHISVVHSSCGDDPKLWKTVLTHTPNLLLLEFGLCRQQGLLDSFSGVSVPALGMKTIIIGVPDRDEDIIACIESDGAAGFILTDSSLDDLLKNIHAVMRGETLCSPRVASLAFSRVSTLARQIGTTYGSNRASLTRRETEIVQLIDEGLSNKEIAARLHIEVSTVKNHIHNILDKLQLDSRYSAVKFMKTQAILTGHS